MMSKLTSLLHAKLIESIKQWGDSQDRIQAEQDHQAALAAVVRDEMQVSEKHFKKVAKAYWADTVKKDRQDAEAQLEMFEAVCGASDISDIKDELAWLKQSGVTMECAKDSIQ